MKKIKSNLKENITLLNNGTLFSIKDYTKYGKYDTIKKSLQRLEKESLIIRIIDGIYYKPKYSKLTNELIYPTLDDIAKYIATKNNWSIIPNGDTCLNILGLSTQMSNVYEYISNGPYREYHIYDNKINFKHASNALFNLSYKNAIIVQAIKSIGKSNINDNVIKTIKSKLNKDEKISLLEECKYITSWIYEIIKKITMEE